MHHSNLAAGNVIVWGHQLLHLKSIFTFFTRPYFSQFTLSPWLNGRGSKDGLFLGGWFVSVPSYLCSPFCFFLLYVCVCSSISSPLWAYEQSLLYSYFSVWSWTYHICLYCLSHITFIYQYTVIRWNYFYLTYLCCDNIKVIFHFSPANLCMVFSCILFYIYLNAYTTLLFFINCQISFKDFK